MNIVSHLICLYSAITFSSRNSFKFADFILTIVISALYKTGKL